MESQLLSSLRCIETYLASHTGPQRAGCYVRDTQTTSQYWSPEVFDWFGLEVAEQAPSLDRFVSLVGEKQLSGVLAKAQRCAVERSRLLLEYQVRQRSGAVKIIRSVGHSIPSRVGRGAAFMGTVFDLTEHYRACAALRNAFEMLLGSGVPDGQTSMVQTPGSGTTGMVPVSLPDSEMAEVGIVQFVNVRGGLSARQFTRVRELTESRLREPLSVLEMAAASGLSATHFARAFKQTTGKTPHRFLLEQRLERARQALARSPSGKLAGIAIDFGFFDQSHFTRHFRRKFGLTPAEFMKQSIFST
jgi:AraC-like DNA-binding protein